METEKKVKFRTATVATSMEELVKWDQDKSCRVRFSTKEHEFPKITEADLRKLSPETRLAYDLAREERAELDGDYKNEEEELLSRIKAGYETGNATKRLEVRGERDGFVYRWIRPDEVDEFTATQGYKIVQNGPERTMANPTGNGPHMISRNGMNELVLVMRSNKLARAARDAKRAKGRSLRDGVDASHLASIERDGFRGVDEGTRGNFKPVVERNE